MKIQIKIELAAVALLSRPILGAYRHNRNNVRKERQRYWSSLEHEGNKLRDIKPATERERIARQKESKAQYLLEQAGNIVSTLRNKLNKSRNLQWHIQVIPAKYNELCTILHNHATISVASIQETPLRILN